jgi:hypothetical protein
VRPEIEPFVREPGRLDEAALLSIIRLQAERKRSLKIWTSSRILQQAGVDWQLPEFRTLLHRVDRMLRILVESGALVRRPQNQTSRNYRDAFACELPPLRIDPAWLTEAVLRLANGISEDRGFDRLPILADAMEETGCTDEGILGHCRGGEVHGRGCYVVDAILGMS